MSKRFGHSTSFADLMSPDTREDYVRGVSHTCSLFSFVVIFLVRRSHHCLFITTNIFQMVVLSIFLSVFLFIWAVVLCILKFGYGTERVGWAAGGGRVDVKAMRKQNVRRSRRKQWIRRNWRIRYVFFGASACLPGLSFVLMNHGVTPFLESLNAVQDLSHQIDTQAYIGIQTATRLSALHEQLGQLVSIDLLQTYCPEYANSDWAKENGLSTMQLELKASLGETSIMLSRGVLDTLRQVTDTTDSVSSFVDWMHQHEWIIKGLLIALNIANGFFLSGVFLTKHDVDCISMQAALSYAMLPVFCVSTVLAVAATCAFAVMGAANAGRSSMRIFCQSRHSLVSLTCI